jgi:F-type H+-transporting ATPase subunit delta
MERLSALYATALFELAKERNDMDDSLSQAIYVRDIFESTDVLRLLLHPQIPRNEKHDLLINAFSGNINDDLLGLLRLILDKNRQAFMISILTAYIEMVESYKNIVTAKVISATELDDNQKTELQEILTEKLNKEVRLLVNVDPDVIAGPYIYVDGYYLDWTLKTRMRELVVYMKEGCTA